MPVSKPRSWLNSTNFFLTNGWWDADFQGILPQNAKAFRILGFSTAFAVDGTLRGVSHHLVHVGRSGKGGFTVTNEEALGMPYPLSTPTIRNVNLWFRRPLVIENPEFGFSILIQPSSDVTGLLTDGLLKSTGVVLFSEYQED